MPHSWIQECLNILRIADNVKDLLSRSMCNWQTELISGEDVKINRGIFHGDTLSPLLFVHVVALKPLTLC